MSNTDIETFAMEAAKREARRAYQRQWRKNNPDKVKASNERYWQKKGREFIESLESHEPRVNERKVITQ